MLTLPEHLISPLVFIEVHVVSLFHVIVLSFGFWVFIVPLFDCLVSLLFTFANNVMYIDHIYRTSFIHNVFHFNVIDRVIVALNRRQINLGIFYYVQCYNRNKTNIHQYNHPFHRTVFLIGQILIIKTPISMSI